jgi:hypothetical protein
VERVDFVLRAERVDPVRVEPVRVEGDALSPADAPGAPDAIPQVSQ